MSMKIIRYIIFIIIFSTNFTLLNAQDFEVAPVKLFFSADPGESQTKTISIKNHANKNTSYSVTTGDYTISNTGQITFQKAGTNKNSIINYLSINPLLAEALPNQDIQIKISFQAPSDDFSSKWGVLFIQPSKEQTSFAVDKGLGAGVKVSPQIALYVYQSPASAPPSVVKIYNLLEVTQGADTLRKFQATLENKGEKIMNCKVYLVAANIITADEKIYNSVSVEAYPQATRIVNLNISRNLPAGKYALSAILDYGSKTTLEGTQITIDVH